MSAEALLSRLEKVQKTGHNRWKACCPAHEDRSPSLAIREEDDGRVLIKCFASCSALDVITAVSLEWDALFPDRPPSLEGYKPIKRPFYTADVFEALRHESHVLGFIAKDMRTGKISDTDYQRLIEAEERIEGINEAAYGR
jgi:hypothetical protein